jgi:hypothetical protein
VNLTAFFPLGLHFCRFAALLRRLADGPNRNLCRKSRFTEPPAKVPEMRFHILSDFANWLIY